MANHAATKKSIRKIMRRTEVNRKRRSRIRTFLRKVEDAIKAGGQKEAQDALCRAQSEMMRGVTKHVVKLNTASRKISRLASRIKAMA